MAGRLRCGDGERADAIEAVTAGFGVVDRSGGESAVSGRERFHLQGGPPDGLVDVRRVGLVGGLRVERGGGCGAAALHLREGGGAAPGSTAAVGYAHGCAVFGVVGLSGVDGGGTPDPQWRRAVPWYPEPLPVWELAVRLTRLAGGGNGNGAVLLRLDPMGMTVDPATREVIDRFAWVASGVTVVVDDGDGREYVLVAFTAEEDVASRLPGVGGGGLWARASRRMAGGLLSLAVWLARPKNATGRVP